MIKALPTADPLSVQPVSFSLGGGQGRARTRCRWKCKRLFGANPGTWEATISYVDETAGDGGRICSLDLSFKGFICAGW